MRAVISRNSRMGILEILITITIVMLKPADATIGYDCRSQIETIRTISLIDIGECDIKEDIGEITHPEIALLNLNEFDYTDSMKCKVEIKRIINYCGMSSHNSIVKNGLAEYMYPVTREMCETALKTGTMKVNNIEIKGLSVDKEHREPIQLGGNVDATGSCDGADYSDLYGSWKNVFVQGTLIINLRKESVKTKVTSDKVVFSSGYQCKLSDGQCINNNDGYIFWDPLPRTNCSGNIYSKLYKGQATLIDTEKDSIITVNHQKTSFTLPIVGSQESCGVTIFKTKHPKLFIVKLDDFESLYKKNIVNLRHDDSEILRYLDSKFMYTEYAIQTKVKSLYTNFMKHNCELERKILKNTLSIAPTQPDKFAHQYMQNPGYMAVVAGEALHIVQCLPVEIKVRHAEKCFNRLPIEIGNQSLFLTPETHIITKDATELSCDSPLQDQYKFGDRWIALYPKPNKSPSPLVLQPIKKMNITFDNPQQLMESGILKKKQLQGMRNRIMFPIDQIAVQQTMARQIAESMEKTGSVRYLFDENTMEELAENFWSRTWGRFINFGTTCAGLIGIYVIVVIIITIIDICIRGYGLHSMYGWSIYIFAALWDPLARKMFIRGIKRGNQIKPTLPHHKLKENEKSKQYIKCINELKATKVSSKPKVDKKPDIKKKPDVKTGVKPNLRPEKQSSDRLNDQMMTKPASKPQVERKPEIPKKPDWNTEDSNGNQSCELVKPVLRPDKQFSDRLNDQMMTKPASKPQVERKPKIPKKPDVNTEDSNGNQSCKVPISAQRQNNPFLNCIRELEGRKKF